LRAIPTLNEIEEVKANLIGLSNGIGMPGRQIDKGRRYERIKKILRILGAK
jgi:hypothetical protein